MAYVKNIDPNGKRILTDLGVTIPQGDHAEVPDDVADSLAEQTLVWQRVNADGSAYVAAQGRTGDTEPEEQESTAKSATAEEAK